MIQKEKEKIENLQLFCEKTESILNAIPHTNETELFEMKKRMSNLNNQLQYDCETNNFVGTDEVLHLYGYDNVYKRNGSMYFEASVLSIWS